MPPKEEKLPVKPVLEEIISLLRLGNSTIIYKSESANSGIKRNVAKELEEYVLGTIPREPLQKCLSYLSDAKVRTLVSNHLERAILYSLTGEEKLIALKRDLGLFLAVLGKAQPPAEQLKPFLLQREARRLPGGKGGAIDILSRSQVMQTLSAYLEDGGDFSRHTAIDKVVSLVGTRTGNPFNELRGDNFLRGTYHSFKPVMDLILDFPAERKEEISAVIDLIKAVADGYKEVGAEGYKEVVSKKYTCLHLAETLRTISKEGYSDDFAVLPTLTQFALTYLKEVPSATPDDFHAFHEKQVMPHWEKDRKKILTLAMRAYQQDRDNLVAITTGIATRNAYREYDPKYALLVQVYDQTLSRIEDANGSVARGLISDRYRFSARETLAQVATQYQENAKQYQQEEALRDLFTRKFQKPHQRNILLGLSYEGKCRALASDMALAQQLCKQFWWMLSHDREFDENAVVGEKFEKAVKEQLAVMERFGSATVASLENTLVQTTESWKGNGNEREKNEYTQLKEKHRELACAIYEIAAYLPASSKILLDTENGLPAVLKLPFLSQTPLHDHIQLIQMFFQRGQEILRRTAENQDVKYQDVEHQDAKYQDAEKLDTKKQDTEALEVYLKWFSGIPQKESLAEVLHELRKTSAEEQHSSLSKRCTFEELFAVERQFCSFYGRAEYSTIRTAPVHLEQPLTLPVPQQGRLYLPEEISFMESKEQNVLLFKAISRLQASCSRFEYFANEQKNFAGFADTPSAERIWGILSYARAVAEMQEKHPKLYQEVHQALLNAGKVYDSDAVLEKEYSPREKILRSLEQHLLLGRGYKNISFLREVIDAYVKKLHEQLPEVSNEDTVAYVKKVYELIDKKFPIQKEKKEQKETISEQSTTHQHLPEQAKIDYAHQKIFYYPEYNGRQRARVVVLEASSVPNTRVAEIKQQSAEEIARLSAWLSSLKPERVTTERHAYDGELDEDALVEMHFDLKAGRATEPNVFINRRINERDVALLLTVNQDKALGKWIDKKRVIDYLRPMMVYLHEAAQALEDDFAVYGYSSRGANEVMVNEFKNFSQPATAEVENALGLVTPLYSSRSGAAYRHFSGLFSQHPARKKIHIDLVARLASDEGYQGEEALQDTQQAVQQERAQGIELYAIGIDNGQEGLREKFERVYGAGRYEILTNLESAPADLVKLYRMIAV